MACVRHKWQGCCAARLPAAYVPAAEPRPSVGQKSKLMSRGQLNQWQHAFRPTRPLAACKSQNQSQEANSTTGSMREGKVRSCSLHSSQDATKGLLGIVLSGTSMSIPFSAGT